MSPWVAPSHCPLLSRPSRPHRPASASLCTWNRLSLLQKRIYSSLSPSHTTQGHSIWSQERLLHAAASHRVFGISVIKKLSKQTPVSLLRVGGRAGWGQKKALLLHAHFAFLRFVWVVGDFTHTLPVSPQQHASFFFCALAPA